MDRMNFIVIDTSNSYLKVALSIDKRTSFIDLKKKFRHIENLLPSIQSLFYNINADKSNQISQGLYNKYKYLTRADKSGLLDTKIK